MNIAHRPADACPRRAHSRHTGVRVPGSQGTPVCNAATKLAGSAACQLHKLHGWRHPLPISPGKELGTACLQSAGCLASAASIVRTQCGLHCGQDAQHARLTLMVASIHFAKCRRHYSTCTSIHPVRTHQFPCSVLLLLPPCAHRHSLWAGIRLAVLQHLPASDN